MQERIHPAKTVTVILDEIGLGRNWFFTFSTFIFKQGRNTKHGQINHFECILYTFALNFNTMSCSLFNAFW